MSNSHNIQRQSMSITMHQSSSSRGLAMRSLLLALFLCAICVANVAAAKLEAESAVVAAAQSSSIRSSSSTSFKLGDHRRLQLDCTLPPPQDLLGDGTLLLSQIYNPVNQTVTVRLEYQGDAWVGFGYAGGLPFSPMVGLPSSRNNGSGGTVVKYFINGQTPSRVNPGSSNQQTATGTSVVQQNGRTVLTFTKPVPEDNERSAVAPGTSSNTRILWAVGTSNTFTTHPADRQYRGFATASLANCTTIRASNPTAPIAPSPTMVMSPPTPTSSSPPAPSGFLASVWARIRSFLANLFS